MRKEKVCSVSFKLPKFSFQGTKPKVIAPKRTMMRMRKLTRMMRTAKKMLRQKRIMMLRQKKMGMKKQTVQSVRK